MPVLLLACVFTLFLLSIADRPVAAADASAAKDLLDVIPALRIGDAKTFRYRIRIDALDEQLVGYVSWAPTDRAAMVLCDAADQLPVMIAVDGKVWMYDIIGGQILLIHAAPEATFRTIGGVAQWQYGLRADFPDAASRLTLDLDLPAFIKSTRRPWPEAWSIDAERGIARFKFEGPGTISTEAIIRTNPNTGDLISFMHSAMETPERHITVTIDEIVRGADPPAWHKTLDGQALAKYVPVVAVRDEANLPDDARERLAKFRDMVRGHGAFILRPAVRDEKLRARIEKHGRISLDFDQLAANEKKLAIPWLKALAEQKFQIPDPPAVSPPASRPATVPADPRL